MLAILRRARLRPCGVAHSLEAIEEELEPELELVQAVVRGGARFDVMMDLVGNRSLSDCRSVLVAGGVYVPCSGGGGDWVGPVLRIVGGLLGSLFTSRRFKTFVMAPNQQDLLFLKELVEAGKARPVIERVYALSEVAEALRHVGEGHAQGQTVIRIAG